MRLGQREQGLRAAIRRPCCRTRPPPNRRRSRQQKRGRLPDLSELTQEVKTLPAPKQVHDKMKGPSRFVGIDVETHALVPRGPSQASFWRTSEFGFLTTADDEALSFLRLVQLGWAYTTLSLIHI